MCTGLWNSNIATVRKPYIEVNTHLYKIKTLFYNNLLARNQLFKTPVLLGGKKEKNVVIKSSAFFFFSQL